MQSILITNAKLVNEGIIFEADVLIKNKYIEKIAPSITRSAAHTLIDAQGKYLLPGIIDDQVHFREPGLTHKADIYTESKAAVAGGITSYMEMPNTIPQTLTRDLLEQKYQRAAQVSMANYAFYIGASNENLEELMKVDPQKVCGIKIFMGSSTGNMLVDNIHTLEKIFSQSPLLIATHCEDEGMIQYNLKNYTEKYGSNIPMHLHPVIRSTDACYKSSSLAVALAKKYNTKLHLLHISTAHELTLLTPLPIQKKHITAEVCIHHLWFNDHDYSTLGTSIKWNPAIKSPKDQKSLWEALQQGYLDVIATDHAPHTLTEKKQNYLQAPSGGPLVQHSLVAMLEGYHRKQISLTKIVEKMCHNPAIIFQISKRGYIREGYFADLVLVDLHEPWRVTSDNIIAKCQWSPFSGQTFQSKITHTLVSGHLAYVQGKFDERKKGERILFER